MGDFQSHEAEQFWRYIAGSLDRLMALAESLPDTQLGWRPPAGDANSILALARHTMGNAADNLLGTLRGQALPRDREAEFVDVSAAELLRRWRTLRPQLEAATQQLTADRIAGTVNHPRRGPIAGREVLIVVARHAAEHLGQAELTRDLAARALEDRP